MDRPSSTEIRAWTPRVDWAEMGYPAPVDPAPDSLDMESGLAVDYVTWVTGRLQDETMPDLLVAAAQKADALRTIQQVMQDSPDEMEALIEGVNLKSFSGGGYSESYNDPGQTQKSLNDARMVNAWPELNRLLWMLMTPERAAYWWAYLTGEGVPAYGVVEMDWSGANRWGGIADPATGGLPGDMNSRASDGYGTPNGAPWPTGSFGGLA